MQAAGLFAKALRVSVGIGRWVERRSHGRRIDEAGALLEAALQKVQRRARVLPHGTRRVLARSRWIWDPGEVKDGVAAGDQLASRGVARIDADGGLRSRALGAAWP